MEDETYVRHGEWTQQVGRADLIDDVADQFERPTPESEHQTLELICG
jgi:hypothetical protein